MRIEIDVPELPEGCAGACLGKDLPDGAVAEWNLTLDTAEWEAQNTKWALDDGDIYAYTLPPYTQTLELPRPEPGHEWVVAKWDCGKDVFSRSFVHLHQAEKETK